MVRGDCGRKNQRTSALGGELYNAANVNSVARRAELPRSSEEIARSGVTAPNLHSNAVCNDSATH